MPEFADLRTQLQQARIEKESARLDLFQANERLEQIKAEKSQLDRVFNPNNPAQVELRQQLEERQTSAAAERDRQAAAYDLLGTNEREFFEAFAPFNDPREQVEQLSDRYPFLLLPVRLETRFKTITIGEQRQNQLWVRVYPDDCAIDTFEATLSEVEVKSARTYWVNRWQAGGVEAQQRGAWRGLVSSHGSGRAAWIVEQYQPLNLSTEPSKAQPTDIILTIETETPLSNPERSATSAYWRAIWLANGDRQSEDSARSVLNAAVGEARASEIVRDDRPRNLEELPSPPLQRSDVTVSVDFVIFPTNADLATKRQSWMQAPKVNVLPDRFVLTGYVNNKQVLTQIGNPIPSPLIVGPDPAAPAQAQIRPDKETGDLQIGADMKWMVDFERAIDVGMGFKIDLDDTQAARGFDRLIVLGLRLSADLQSSQNLLETLIQHHQNSRNGFSLIPQGTPTNNTEQKGAGFSRADDADDSFDDYFRQATQGANADSLFAETDNRSLKRDGQWLAEFLGIDPAVLKKVRHSNGTDQSEAKAMNAALWPATLGYTMDTMMRPVFGEETIEGTRYFFNNFVSGRGSIPAVRIGNQPYGILPTTVFSRISWMDTDTDPSPTVIKIDFDMRRFLADLNKTLRLIDADWAKLVTDVSYVGKSLDSQGQPVDAHQILLDILGLHSGSVEYYQRYAQSLEHIFNLLTFVFLDFGIRRVIVDLLGRVLIQLGMDLLGKLGYRGDATPEVLEKFFLGSQNLLKGSVIDDRPLSETDPIRAYTPDNKNYIQWLIDAAATSLDRLNQESGFIDNKSPTALLYILLRYALAQGYWDSSIRLHLNAEILSTDLANVYKEPSFIHISNRAETSESRWQYLYKTEPRITDSNSLLVSDYITQNLGRELLATRYLTEQIEALKLLNIPTARLERLFAEHIDCCTYRLDAWWLGLVNYQLEFMRSQGNGIEGEGDVSKGSYLGAYGWLENVRSENKVLTPVQLEPELNEIFNKTATTLVLRDSSNEGYIHAPSLNHAVTAAVLRNGYLSNNTSPNLDPTKQPLAVNLSSERVRLALSVLEGIRNGQSLSALLGYQLERGLHDRYTVAELDRFIFKLRKAFPLRAKRFKTTNTPDLEGVSIEAIEARNVIDGLGLVNYIKQTGNKNYPFGKPPSLLPDDASPAQKAAINAEVDRILNIHDAVSDLAIAESVHQAVQGNYDRAAANLDAYSKANYPPEPDVVQTPRSGITLTHRVGLHLETGLSSDPIINPRAQTPRAQAEPALNQWLTSMMPPPDRVACKVTYRNPVNNTEVEQIVTQQNLQLQPIDLLYLLRTDSQQAMTELDDRILLYVIQTFSPRPDAQLEIKYTERLNGKISFFELAPLMHSLRSLVIRSRPLMASDIALHNQATKAEAEKVSIDRQRIEVPLNSLTSLKTEIEAFKTSLGNSLENLDTLLQDPVANSSQIQTIRAQIITAVDDRIVTAIDLLPQASRFGIPQTGWGFALAWKQRTFDDLLGKVRELENRWQARLKEFDKKLTDYNALPATATDAERFDLLQQAERLVSTTITIPLPATPNDLRTAMLTKRTNFSNKLGDFSSVLTTTTTDVSTLLAAIRSLLPIADFDLTEFQLSDTEDNIVLFTRDLSTAIVSLANEIERRLKEIGDKLAFHNTNAQATIRVQALQDAAKALLGEEFQLIPEFQLEGDRGDEWAKSLNDSKSGDLTNYLTDTVKIAFPVDDWLYGAARVREKLHHWERIVMLTGAFDRTEPELQPIQLPYKAKDHWLALQFPYDPDPATKTDPTKNYQFDGDRLLYTAHYAVSFDKNTKQCGLLLDEWTEVIPMDTETTGIAFHYDRPNSEPPQTMLLVTPPNFTGKWQWQDLVDALNETLDMAKKRAVEPRQVDATPYARLLPAAIMAATLYPISISANLAINNEVLDTVVVPPRERNPGR
jgi:hypothetical protein